VTGGEVGVPVEVPVEEAVVAAPPVVAAPVDVALAVVAVVADPLPETVVVWALVLEKSAQMATRARTNSAFLQLDIL